MSRADDLVYAACLTIAALSIVALVLLRWGPERWLRCIDGDAEVTR